MEWDGVRVAGAYGSRREAGLGDARRGGVGVRGGRECVE